MCIEKILPVKSLKDKEKRGKELSAIITNVYGVFLYHRVIFCTAWIRIKAADAGLSCFLT